MTVSPKLQKGIKAAQKGDMRRAAEMFQSVLRSEPKNADALHLAGAVQHKLGKSDNAIKLIERSIVLDPENPMSHNNLGNVLKEMGRDEEAASSYRKALEHDPLNVQCLNNVGVTLRNSGNFEVAIDTLKQAIQLAPGMAELHHNLGRTYAASGNVVEAANCFRDELSLAGDWTDPVAVAQIFVGCGRTDEAEVLLVDYLDRHPDHGSAKHQLAAVRGDEVGRASDAYVTDVFDGFASSFDATLARLDYRGPEYVAAAVSAHLSGPKGDLAILDIGCGTGLCGPLIADYKSHLIGIDLSAEMMRRAEKHGCYDQLRKAELQEYLEGQPAESFDVAVCADTLVYLGELERTFAGVRHILRPGGLFVTTVESLDEAAPRDHTVDATGRFKHKRSYLEGLAAANELEVVSVETVILRKEVGAEVEGFVLSIRRDS